ncbi:MAG: TonB-dependent receptor [Sphingomonas sp.]|uniref:TonB-dependent receptor n=1 Tax=Sphingomonas sp. TaxID=28214 RepID=UPI0025D54605|nr:TonB-dependent receptor [Sphingomonas sp.]MBX9882673.1 TonB-dependent receptor [Sphingomonas sp.]
MKTKFALLAGVVAGMAPCALMAQQVPAPATGRPSPGTGEAPPPGETPPKKLQFRGADGKPLPPEIQKLLEEQFKNGVPASGTVLTLPAAKDGQAPTPPADTANPNPGGTAPGGPAGPNKPQFRSLDGKPLPPEILRQLEEQFKDGVPGEKGAAPRGAARASNGDVVVSSSRPRGSVVGNIPPERSFSQVDLRAFGADNIGALLEAISSQTSSNRGRGGGGPVTLLNGKRVSDFSEIARIPSEAIERMEIFPEELALKYGYRADQKVVNIVTFQRFRSKIGQLAFVTPGEGGRESGVANGDLLAINGDTRMSLGATYNRAAALLESERDVRQFAGMPELARFRTLLPESEQFGLNGVISGPLLQDVAATLNGRFDVTQSDGLLGLGLTGPIRRATDRTFGHLGTTINGRVGRWQWTVTSNYDHIDNKVLTDAIDGSGRRDLSLSTDRLANADFLFSGPVFSLPGGPLTASVRLGADFRDFTSRATFGATDVRADLSRDRGAAQIDIDLPILNRAENQASPLGNLSLNANAAVERLSDAGTLRTYGYGLSWSPVPAINIVASATQEEGAPTLEQLGGPLLVTPNSRTFDFLRREVVDIARVSGGNALLRTDDRETVRFGLNVHPLAKTDLSLSFDYVSTRIENPIAPFPILTAQIEAAFPERFARDAQARLVGIDGRPVNFAEANRDQIRWGINFTRPLGEVPAILRDARVRVFNSEADVRRAFPNAVLAQADSSSALGRGAANLTSRLFLSLYHNWYLEDSIRLRNGAPTLDLLTGGAVDFLGGRRQHEIEFQAGAFKKGFGARLTATWRSGTEIRGFGGPDGVLRFNDYAVVNLNLFANLGERYGTSHAPGWLKGMRATLGVTNLFNTRPQVRDETGATPISYQPAYLDPLGRTLTFNLRKVF